MVNHCINPWTFSAAIVLASGIGVPLAAAAFGPARVYVYAYNIASRMGPPASG